MFRSFGTTKFVSALLIVLLTASLYSPWLNHNLARVVPVTEVPKAYAICGHCATEFTQAVQFLEDKWNTIQATVSAAANTIQAGGTITILGKEFGWDTLAWILAKAVIRSLTASIVNWINSGFQGGPTFLTDFTGFLEDTADFAVEEFLQGSDIEFICSPFRLDVQVAVALSHSNRGVGARCTIDGIVNNVENFLNGAFAEGGFRGWLDITQNPQNTRAGAFLNANVEARLRVLDAQNREIEMLSFGEGFLSTTFCELIEEEQNCIVEVPGQIIEEQLTHVLGSPQRSAELADEIGESIGVIASSLVGFTLRSGIAALSGGGFNGGSGSFLDALVAEGNAEAFPQIQNQLQNAVLNERKYIDLYIRIGEIIDDLIRRNEEAREQARVFVRRGFDDDGEPIVQEVACYALEVPSNILALRERASSTIPLGEAAIIVVEDLQAQFNATTSPTVRNDILNEFVPMQQAGAVTSIEPAQINFLNQLIDQYNATSTTDNVRQSIIDTIKAADLVLGIHNEVEFSRAEVTDFRLAQEDGDRFIDSIAAEVARCQALEDSLNRDEGNDRDR